MYRQTDKRIKQKFHENILSTLSQKQFFCRQTDQLTDEETDGRTEDGGTGGKSILPLVETGRRLRTIHDKLK